MALLNDGLEETTSTTTDEYGVFKIEGIDPSSINLVRTSQDDANVLIDMFIYNRDGNIIGKPISLGHNLFSFQANEPESNQLKILTDQDMVVMVKRGMSTMTGKVVDRETFLIGKEGVRVGLYTPRKALLRSAITDHSGAFLFTQLDEEEYIVKVDHKPDSDYVEMVLTDDKNEPYAMSNSNDQSADGYFRFRKLAKQSIDLETMEMADESGFKHHYYTMLSEEEPGVPYELHSIVFESGASDLSRQNDELDQLARELTESPEIAIKIDGHTDNVGEVRANQSLSLKRAEAVKAYLVSKGVSSNRISCQGYGAVKPIASNATEKGRSLNRRVVFAIVEE